ncbi:unnamed protein product [Cylicocyclus nassatus]|uniref:Uncharacterized protein n=1 Tax=Cylicocyclus nassatus TaxID=53992 RepID=A0AA36GNY4_CYLNA|nr:unnamed protein product [Cylicocyclus nassatus]
MFKYLLLVLAMEILITITEASPIPPPWRFSDVQDRNVIYDDNFGDPIVYERGANIELEYFDSRPHEDDRYNEVEDSVLITNTKASPIPPLRNLKDHLPLEEYSEEDFKNSVYYGSQYEYEYWNPKTIDENDPQYNSLDRWIDE